MAGTVAGGIPYRLALSGGWIDQPFVSRLDPEPPGSMTVVSLEPDFRFMDRAGMATSTRRVATAIWGDRLPDRDPAALVRELYAAENAGKAEPSGSQDMVGICYAGVSRMDFDHAADGGVFPARVESNNDPEIAAWLERVIKILPVAQRPADYNPLEIKQLEASWVRRLGRSGRDCWNAILSRDLSALATSFNETMEAWAALLPGTLRHRSLDCDLEGIYAAYRDEYGGALYSGCGGGYLFVPTEREVPGSFSIRVRRLDAGNIVSGTRADARSGALGDRARAAGACADAAGARA